MEKNFLGTLVLGMALAVSGISAVKAGDISDLGTTLTPIGAEVAGSADGRIPAWDGGIKSPPPGWKPGEERPNPYASDAKLFTINKSNVDQYAANLTAGQIKMLKTYPGYRMDVYPTHRSCAYPQSVYDDTRKNASIAKIDQDGFLLNGKGGFLFPMPKSGAEVIWNHKMRYQGVVTKGGLATATLTEKGSYTQSRSYRTSYSLFSDPEVPSYDAMKGVAVEQLIEVTAPPVLAGSTTLVRETLSGDRQTWRYLPAQRRVRQVPNFTYDTPVAEFDGLIVTDQVGMYNGAMDKYDWKLLGKKELYISYNDWELNSSKHQYKDILTPVYPNPDVMRYELHRVWKVEATLRPGARHLYSRRVFYSDEDSWLIAATELYDGRGELWRAQEGPIGVVSELPACINQAQFHYDLNADRYVAQYLRNQEADYQFYSQKDGVVEDSTFTPSYLRQSARR